MNLMHQPEQLWRSLTRLTALLTLLLSAILGLLGALQVSVGLMVGVLTLGGIVAFYAWLVRRFAQPGSRSFHRMLLLSGLVKYPVLMLVIYLVVQGGMPMTLGFVVGVLLPLGILTALAIRTNR